jgi:hypothetical protein
MSLTFPRSFAAPLVRASHVPSAAMAVVPRDEFSLQSLLFGCEFDAGVLSMQRFKLVTALIGKRGCRQHGNRRHGNSQERGK